MSEERDKRPVKTATFSELRRQAQARLKVRHDGIDAMSPDQIQILAYELQVHQIELEMQNEELRRAQEELTRSRDRYQELFDKTPVGYLVVDNNGMIKEVNLTAVIMLGKERSHLQGQPLSRFITPEHQDELYRQRKRLLHGEEAHSFELEMKGGGERRFFAQAVMSSEQASGDQPGGALIAFTDISDRKRMEHELRESETMFRAIFENTLDGILLVDIQSHRFIMGNQRFARMLDYAENEIPQLRLEDICPQEDVVEQYERQASGEISIAENIPVKRRDGSVFSADINANLMTLGGKRYLVGIFRDISKRKRTEEALRDSKDQLSLLVQGSNTGLWDWDLRNNQVYFSTEWKKQIGYEEHEISNDFQEWQSRVHPDDLERTLHQVHSFIKSPWPDYQVEFRFRHKDGSYRWILSTASLIHDESGQALRMLGSHVDITRQKQAEEQIQASLEEKEILLREVHHRVKNNLQVIASLLALEARTLDDDATRQALQISEERVRAIGMVHEELFNAANLAQLDMLEYLRRIAHELFVAFGIGENIVIDISGDDVQLDLDKSIHLGLIVNELLTNSLKCAFPDNRGGKIQVELRQNEEIIELTVADDGVGLPPELDIEKCETLGLRLVRSLAQQFNGEAMLQATNPGTRCRIVIRKGETL